MRKLASIQRILKVEPIPGAVMIEKLTVLGYVVVSQKGIYKVGDLVIYIEPDAWVPNHLAPFLSKNNEPSVYNGVKGERLRTIRLRGCLSSGLLLKIENIFGVVEVNRENYIDTDNLK